MGRVLSKEEKSREQEALDQMKRASALCIQSQPMRFYDCQFIQDFLFEWKKLRACLLSSRSGLAAVKYSLVKGTKKKNDRD